MQSVCLENDAIRAEVWPRLGGKVSSVVDKSDGFELLFSFPAEIPTEPNYGKPYDASWYAGWDECFPAVGSGRYPGHPYDGIEVPDHGEVYGIPVGTAVPTGNGITTVWNGLRFGYRLTRKLELTTDGLRASYTLVNLAPFEFRFVWAQHALFSMESPIEIDLPPGPARWSHDATGADRQVPFDWPRLDGVGDFSRPARLPIGGWKVFSLAQLSHPARVRYPDRKRFLEIDYVGDPAAYWGVWINTGGWNHQRHFAIEPTTGRFDPLDRSVADNSAGRVDGLATVHWQVNWKVGGMS